MTPIHLSYDPSPANGRLLIDVRATRTADGGEVYAARVDFDDADALDNCAQAIARRLEDGTAAALVLARMQADASGLRARTGSIEPAIELVAFNTIERKPVRWLWPGRFALGKITLVVGDPGLGKSYLTCYMAATISRGLEWSDGTACPAGSAMMINVEDDPADTIGPRLDAACADPAKVFSVPGVAKVDPKSGEKIITMFSLQAHIPLLRRTLDTHRDTRAIFIDPISAVLGNVDSHNNSEVRGLLAPLAALAPTTTSRLCW